MFLDRASLPPSTREQLYLPPGARVIEWLLVGAAVEVFLLLELVILTLPLFRAQPSHSKQKKFKYYLNTSLYYYTRLMVVIFSQ
jgi:hypothetical protein